MLTRLALVLTLGVAILAVPAVQAQDKKAAAEKDDGEAKRIADATALFSEIMGAPDKSIPRAILGKAEGIAIFPNTIKAGLVVGGMRGRGIIMARNGGNWSAPAFLTLTGGSFGLQIGGQAADIILVINSRKGLDSIVGNQFKIGADASAAAGPVGRDAQASTDIQLRAEILSYSRARGLFAGVTVNGSTLRQDADANGRFYGTKFTTKQILFEGKGGSPAPVGELRGTLNRYAK